MPEKRILIVDDSPLILQIVRELLEAIPATLVSTESDGVGALARMNGKETWDLVLLDMEMPGMGGLEVLEVLQGRGRHEPIVAFSGDDDPKRRVRLAELGVLQILKKPVDAAVLEALVAGITGPREVPEESRIPDRWPPSVPFGTTLQRFNGNLDLYRRSLARFDEEYGIWAHRPSLAAAYPTNKELRFFLHTLKGVAGYLGSREIVAAIEEFQHGSVDQEGHRLLGALARFIQEAGLFLGISQDKPLPRSEEGGTVRKGDYLNQIRDMLERHDSALLDQPRPPTNPAFSSEEVMVMEELQALVQDYEFELALPLVGHLLDGCRSGEAP